MTIIRQCPVTGGVPTRMTRQSFESACQRQQQATSLSGHAVNEYCREECKGEIVPHELEYIDIKQEKKSMGRKLWTRGECDLCHRTAAIRLRADIGVNVCRPCDETYGRVKKMPEVVLRMLEREHGEDIFPVPMDMNKALESTRGAVEEAAFILVRAVDDVDSLDRDDIVSLASAAARELAIARRMAADIQKELDELREGGVNGGPVPAIPLDRLLRDAELLAAAQTISRAIGNEEVAQ